MERHWILIAQEAHTQLFEEGASGPPLFEAFRRPTETLQEFGRRIARAVSDLAAERGLTHFEIFAEPKLLGPIRLSLAPCCSSRLIVASNAVGARLPIRNRSMLDGAG